MAKRERNEGYPLPLAAEASPGNGRTNRWTPEEIEVLFSAAEAQGEGATDWERVAAELPGRSATAAEQKYRYELTARQRVKRTVAPTKRKRRKKTKWSGPINEDGSAKAIRPASGRSGSRGRARGRGRGRGRGSVSGPMDDSGIAVRSHIDEYNRHEPVSRAEIEALPAAGPGSFAREWQFVSCWEHPAPSELTLERYPAIAAAWCCHAKEISRALTTLLRPVYIGRLLHPLHPARRHEGQHSFGLFAAGFIAAGSDIGYYCGKLMTEAEMDDEGELRSQGRYAIDFDLKDFPAFLRQQQAQQTRHHTIGAHSESDSEVAAPTHGANSGMLGDAPGQTVEDSANEVTTVDNDMPLSWASTDVDATADSPVSSSLIERVGDVNNKAHRAGIVDHEAHMLVMDASLHRNEMAFMNDYRWAPIGEPPVTEGAATNGRVARPWARCPNVETYTAFQYFDSSEDEATARPEEARGGEACDGMWPCVVVRTTRDVMEGEELLWDVSLHRPIFAASYS